MERIYLTPEEKKVLRELRRGNSCIPSGMDNFSFADAVMALRDKGFIKAVVNDVPYKIHGNVLNTGLIDNLPQNACVEVPCMIDGCGVNPCRVGSLPEQCAALNRTNINVQNMTIEAARTHSKDAVYMAAYLDPHTAAELSLDDIRSLCDDLFEAHKGWLPEYR